jgi:hypothetical protein
MDRVYRERLDVKFRRAEFPIKPLVDVPTHVVNG